MMRQRFTLLLTCSMHSRLVERLVRHVLLPRECLPQIRINSNDLIYARKDTFLPRLAPHLRPANPELR
jgi:hypothetical protein